MFTGRYLETAFSPRSAIPAYSDWHNNNNSILIYLHANSTAQGPITK
jgi:hypothetical protein